MIDRDAQPTSHRSPYAKIDVAHPGQPRVITLDEWVGNGGGADRREPDPAAYRYDLYQQAWILRD